MNVKREIKKAEDVIHEAILRAVHALYVATELIPTSIEVSLIDATTHERADVVVGSVRIKVGI